MTWHHTPHRRPARPTSRGPRRERGAVLVELSIVSLFLIVLGAGTFDLSQGWRAGLVVNEAARTGARTGSAMGVVPLTDYYALTGARAALASGELLDAVDRVVIYRSDTVDGKVPATCTTGTSSSSPCNILTGAQFRAMTQADFNTTTGCFTPAQTKNWCPSSRVNVQLNANYFGIWISTTKPRAFPMLGKSLTVTRTAVMRLEPTEN